jgi:hypothetical protein
MRLTTTRPGNTVYNRLWLHTRRALMFAQESATYVELRQECGFEVVGTPSTMAGQYYWIS